ncbi:MAG: CoA-binding protein, partial [Proteobacteria bacterium]|nr:CoA-binding protein [Pseudomonadota bacterium]
MPETLVEQLDHIFKPKSVAVIGASNDYSKWGGRVLGNALRSEFRGRIYPVNPRGGEIQGVEAYKDVRDIPDHVEMAIFTLPAAHVPAAMKACVEKGVKGAYMISAGFAETGEEGRKLEQETVRIANEGGLRFAGPNGNGIWTSAVNLNILPFTGIKNGPLAFISQSGTFCGVAGRAAESRGYGMSKVVAIGNQANITAADYLEYLGQDEDTKVIGMYLEGLKEGRRFFQVAKKVSRTKPIIIFKGGSSDFGARATLSHTASIAGEEAVFQAMCKQAGIIQVPEIEHLFIMAEALWSQPIPPGNRVAVIGNGGQCVTIVDLLA